MNNTTPDIIELPEPQTATDAPISKASSFSRSCHTRTGKIARLPKATRDQLDQMLEDGLTVDQIKDTLGDALKDLTPSNFTEWKKGGHQDWCKDQFWRQEMRLRQEAFTDILQGADPIKLPESGLQLTATALCELLREMCDTDADDQRTRVEKHVRIANALSRLSRSIIQLQQFRNECARDQAAELKQRDINEELSDNEFEILTSKMDQVFRRPRKKQASSSDSSSSSFSSSNPVSSSSSPAASAPADANATVAVPPAVSTHCEHGAANPIADIPVGSPSPSPVATEITSANYSAADSPAPVPAASAPTATPPDSSSPAPQKLTEGESTLPRSTLSRSDAPPSFPLEHCLECRSPLPPLLPNGARPRARCDACGFELPPPGSCVEPAIEQCQVCFANLPRLLPNGHRALDYCHHCTTPLLAPAT